MAWEPSVKLGVFFALCFYIWSAKAAVIAPGVKLQVSQIKIEKKKTFFRHKKKRFVYSGALNIITKPNEAKEFFFTFDELKILLRENKIALGGVAGGGGGK